jgi:formate dehydrogenase major subunit
VIQGSNMAEAHPVGFQWVMEAKARGARVIHVDPRFSRTSAMADLHVPIRAGSDIAFLGGIVNYILSGGRDFREYVVSYTNAPVILSEQFRDTEDLDGLFSGFDPELGRYDPSSWMYEGMAIATDMGERVPLSAAGEQHGAGGARLEHGQPPRSTRRSSTRAASSRYSSGTTRATRPRWSSGSAASRGRGWWRWPARSARPWPPIRAR